MMFYRHLFGLSLTTTVLAQLILGTALQASPSLAMAPLGDLNIEVQGLRNRKGVVCVALFDSPVGFPADGTKAVSNRCFKIDAATQRLNLGQVKYGRYALSILHDENEDQQLNTGFLGIPKEGIGFSQNPKLRRRLPFEETSFEFEQSSPPLQVRIKYF